MEAPKLQKEKAHRAHRQSYIKLAPGLLPTSEEIKDKNKRAHIHSSSYFLYSVTFFFL